MGCTSPCCPLWGLAGWRLAGHGQREVGRLTLAVPSAPAAHLWPPRCLQGVHGCLVSLGFAYSKHWAKQVALRLARRPTLLRAQCVNPEISVLREQARFPESLQDQTSRLWQGEERKQGSFCHWKPGPVGQLQRPEAAEAADGTLCRPAPRRQDSSSHGDSSLQPFHRDH